jgi:fused signal recognition particle receptor
MFKSLKEKLKGWISKSSEEISQDKIDNLVKTTKKEKKKKEKEVKKLKEEEKKTIKAKAKKTKKKTKPKKEKPVKEKSIKVKTKKESPTEGGKTTHEKGGASRVSEAEPEEISGDERFTLSENDKSKLSTRDVNREHATPPQEEPETPEPEEPKEEEKGFLSSLFGKKEEPKPTPKPEPTKEPEKKPEPEKPKPKLSFFQKALTEEKFEKLFDELELILLQNNVAYEATENIKISLKEKLIGESAKTNIEQALKESIEELLINPPNLIEQIKEKNEKPFVILFAGINGSGKTTTIAKLAHFLKKRNITVCLASADTFRAAAIEQLQVHADRLEVPLIKKDYGADPASVGFDAIKYAKHHKIDVVLIDTAGRMNNRETLMKEIEKISRVNSPDLKIFLGESITGNDATEQAKDFNDAIGIDGMILSKADVDEKGGTAISVAQVTKKPIYFLGTGQTYDDLEIFNKENLIKKIFGEE